MKAKRLCRAQRAVPRRRAVAECERKHSHKGKHRARWREGFGGRFVDITVRWE